MGAFRELTGGQRWTAGLAVAMAVVVVTIGLPGAPRAAAPAIALPASQLASPVAVPLVTPTISAPTPPIATVPVAAPTAQGRAPVAPLRVVALADAAGAPLARALLGDVPIVNPSGDAAEVCAEIGDEPGVVVAALVPPAPLTRCLMKAGAIVVAFEPGGTRREGRGAVLSTDPGVRASLTSLATWLGARRPGTVGLVVGADIDPAVATKAMHDGGVAPAEVAVVASDADIVDGVASFRMASVTTVVFAVDPSLRQQWVTLEGLLGTPPAYVVSDVALGTLATGDPAGFDGARAHTVLRPPWQLDTAAQVACRARVRSAGIDLKTVDAAVLLGWCTHAAIARRASAVGDVDGAYTTVTASALPSALTGDLASVDGRWGPASAAEIRWHSTCSCWQVVRGFST